MSRGFFTDCTRRLGEWHRGIKVLFRNSSAGLDESGGALIEFTLVAPLFFLIVFGIIEWGSIFYLRNNMINAAREAARGIAVQGLTTGQAQTVAQNFLAGNGQTFAYIITDHCTLVPPNKVPEVTVQINVDAAAASLVNFMGIFTGQTLTAKVTMRKELACA
jgi:Flp pilus assembly protein TadG